MTFWLNVTCHGNDTETSTCGALVMDQECAQSSVRVVYFIGRFLFVSLIFYKKPNLRKEKSLDKQLLTMAGHVHRQCINRTVFNRKRW